MHEPDPSRKEALPRFAADLLKRVEWRRARMTRRRDLPGLWRSAALIGMIGWAVVLPMLIGIAAGSWIDRRWPSRFSWTLMLLFGGVIAGCVNAWTRVREEQEEVGPPNDGRDSAQGGGRQHGARRGYVAPPGVATAMDGWMEDMLFYSLVFFAGFAMGVLFFGGLWYTVRALETTKHPILLTQASFWGRLLPVVIGFTLVTGQSWENAVLCLAGFVVARMLMTRINGGGGKDAT